jgi:hypothetical protein
LLQIYNSSLAVADGADLLQCYMWSLAYESMVQESIYRLLSCRGSLIRLMTRREIVLDWWYRIRDRCGSEGNCWGNVRCGPLRGSSGWNVAVFSIVGAFASILFGKRHNFCEPHSCATRMCIRWTRQPPWGLPSESLLSLLFLSQSPLD